MQIYRGFEAIREQRPRVATVGSFDGVHRGHGALVERIKLEAETHQMESMVITFDPHPRLVLEQESSLQILSTSREKIALLEAMGVESLLIIPFDRAFSQLPPDRFIRLLIEQANVRSLVVGYDHRFGRNKAGNYNLLQELGINSIEVEEQQMMGEHLSSTAIRHVIERGEMAHAARLLGHPYLLAGELLSDGAIHPEEPRKLLPCSGNYAVEIEGVSATLHIKPDHTLRLSTPSVLTSGEKIITFLAE